MSNRANCFIPSHSLFKWIITDEEENAIPSIVLTIGDDEPVRSYVFNQNSCTKRVCKQLEQKANKSVLLLFSDPSLSACSCFAEVVYTLSEQGKEYMNVSIPLELLQSFQATRSLIHRNFPAIQYHVINSQYMGCVYQLFDFTIVDCIISSSTNSLSCSFENGIQPPLCLCCHQSSCDWNDSFSLSPCCFYCQLFNCSSCSVSSSPSHPYTSSLPNCHFYWFQPRVTKIAPFCVFHFFEEFQGSVHPAIASLLAMKDCSVCRNQVRPLVFAYIPSHLLHLESIQLFLSQIPAERVISIPYTKKAGDVLKADMNHLMKMNCCLPSSLPLPTPSFSLSFPLQCPQPCHNLAYSYYPLPLTDTERFIQQQGRLFHSWIQELHEDTHMIIGGSGFILTKTLENETKLYYIPPHYTKEDDLQKVLSQYKRYRLICSLHSSHNSVYQYIDLFQQPSYILNCKKSLSMYWTGTFSDRANYMAVENMKENWISSELASSVLKYETALDLYRTRNQSIPTSSQSLLFLGTGGGVASFSRQNTSILWRLRDEYGVLLDCGCNVVNRLGQLVGEDQRNQILHRLLIVIITHAHFDHFAYLTNLILFYQNHPRSFILPILLPEQLISYYQSLFANELIHCGITLLPIQESFLNTTIPIASLTPYENGEGVISQLKRNIGVRLFHNNHNSQSFAVAFDTIQTRQNILLFSGDTTPLQKCFENTTILIHECSFDDEDRNIEFKKHTTLGGFVNCLRKCSHRPLFSFLTHFSGRKRMNETIGKKSISTDEQIAKRLVEENPDLISEIAIAFDGLLVDFDKQFPSVACELQMLF